MAAPTVKGVQLPGGTTTGPITGGFVIIDPAGDVDTEGLIKQIVLPATVIVNAAGVEIGSQILKTLERIANSLEELNITNENILGG